MTNITTAQLQPILTAWQAALNQLNSLIVQASVSPPGTQVTGPNGPALSDPAGNQWTMGNATSGGQFSILENGGIPAGGGGGTFLEIDINGVIWANTPSGWYKRITGGWQSMGSIGPVIA
jgi:hypothetical protein